MINQALTMNKTHYNKLAKVVKNEEYWTDEEKLKNDKILK